MKIVFHDSGAGSLAIQYLSSVTATHGHDSRIFHDCSLNSDYLAQGLPFASLLSLSCEQVCEGILASAPDVVGFSMFSFRYKSHLELIKQLKQMRPEVIVVCGGIHVTLLPESALKNEDIDFVIVGEGEISFPSLLEHLSTNGLEVTRNASAKELPGVWNQTPDGIMGRGFSPVIHELDSIPFPDKSASIRANPSLSLIYSIVGSRGCLGACSYCTSATVARRYRENGEKYFRMRSVDNVIQELNHAISLYHPKRVAFWDDVFGAKSEWLTEFCDRYKTEIGLPFELMANPHLFTEKDIRKLADCGCTTIEFGFQSANESVRREILKRVETNDQVRKALKSAKSEGILVELDLIVGLPGETEQHITETVEFLTETRPDFVNCAYLQYFPNTPITDYASERGYLDSEYLERIERGESVKPMRMIPSQGPKSGEDHLDIQYRILPYRLFFASKLPPGLSRRLNAFVGLPIVRSLCSALATPFLYATRIVLSTIDPRSFFIMRQVFPFFHSVLWVLKNKRWFVR